MHILLIIITTSVALLLAGIVAFRYYPPFGSSVEGEALQKIQKSAHYNNKEGKFQNQDMESLLAMKKNESAWKAFKGMFKSVEHAKPESRLPELHPNFLKLPTQGNEAQFVWFGHSSFLLSIDGKNILIDPVFSEASSPFPFLYRRFQSPVVNLEQLPAIDIILISHDHYDHLDIKSIQFFKDKKTRFIVPLGVDSHLKGWGIDAQRIKALDWWESAQEDTIQLTAAPSQHFSGRKGFGNNTTLWASWAIRGAHQNIYFSGDSGYASHFQEIGNKLGPFDVAVLENGQYNENWRSIHMFPEETAQAYFDLKANMLIPVHWGMFALSAHSWSDPVVRIKRQAQQRNINLVTPKIGELVTLSPSLQTKSWWESIVASENQKDIKN